MLILNCCVLKNLCITVNIPYPTLASNMILGQILNQITWYSTKSCNRASHEVSRTAIATISSVITKGAYFLSICRVQMSLPCSLLLAHDLSRCDVVIHCRSRVESMWIAECGSLPKAELNLRTSGKRNVWQPIGSVDSEAQVVDGGRWRCAQY